MGYFAFRSPALPLSTPQYDVRQQNELNRALRLYFTRFDTFLVPYGSFYDTTDQIAVSTTTAYPMTFNTTSYSVGVAVSSNSRMYVDTSGTYNIQFSCQLVNTTNASQDVDIWFRKNGTDITDSNTRFGLAPRKGIGDPYHSVAALNFFLTLKSGDYVEIVWCTTDVGAYLEYYTAPSSPTRPAIPSVIATMVWMTA
jgi:hypothetical protein